MVHCIVVFLIFYNTRNNNHNNNNKYKYPGWLVLGLLVMIIAVYTLCKV